jgi:hypothetical protein
MIVKDKITNKYVILNEDNYETKSQYYFDIMYYKYGINLNVPNKSVAEILKLKMQKYY